jgi:hypothetical protein
MPLSGRNERNAKGQYLPGVSGNPGGEPGWIRKRFTADFLTAFHQHFRHEGKRVIAKVAKQQPAAYLRCLTMLVPKEMKVEQTGGIKAMTDEQLDEALAALRQLLADREAQAANVIEGSAEPVALPPPEAQSPEATPGPTQKHKTNRLMREADTAVGPRERKPRLRKVLSPASTRSHSFGG